MFELHLLQILVAFQLVYFLVRNKIDFLLVFFLSSLLYHWQVVYGRIWVPPYRFDVNSEAVIILFILMVTIQLFAFLNDCKLYGLSNHEYRLERDRDQAGSAMVLILVSFAATAYSLVLAGDSIFSGKQAFIAAEGLTYNFFTYFPAAMAFLYGVASKRKSIIILALLPLFVYLFIGYRAVLVTAVVGALAIVYFNEKLISTRTLKAVLIVVALYLFFVTYKFSYIDIKEGTFDFFAQKIARDVRFENQAEFLLWGMFSAEFGQVASNLVLTSQQDLTSYYSFKDVVLGSTTILNRLLEYNEDITRFSRVIRVHANPGFSYGLGGTLWGEMYQAGGYLGVWLAAVIIVGILTKANLAFYTHKESFPLLLYLVAFLSFYVHRNDFVLLLGNLKNVVFLMLFAYGILLIVKNRVKVSKRTKYMILK